MTVAALLASSTPTRAIGISRPIWAPSPHRQWSRFAPLFGRQTDSHRGFSYRVLGSGPPKPAQTANSANDDGTGVFEAECLVDRLGTMAHDRVDLEKLRFKRLLKDIMQDRAGWVLPTLVQTVLALEKHPSALESPAIEAVLQRLVAGLSLTSEGLRQEDIVGVLLQLAQARLYPGSGLEALELTANRASAEDDADGSEDEQDEWLTALRPKVRPRIERAPTHPAGRHAKAKAKATAATASSTTQLPKPTSPSSDRSRNRAELQALFWKQLLPQALEKAEELPLHRKVDLLFALCTAWESFPEEAGAPLDDQGLSEAITQLARASWEQAAPQFLSLHQQQPQVATLSRLLLCLGKLNQFRIPDLEGGTSMGRIATLVSRTLKVDLFNSATVPRLVEVHLGLEGLGLNCAAPRHGRAIQRLLSSHLQGASGATGGMQNHELVEALLLLRSVGRLTAEEPIVLPLLQRATNSVDSLNRGERMVLRRLLSMLARDAGCHLNDGTSVTSGGNGPAGDEDDRLSSASSAVATICRLERLDWFSRKPRAQVSWWKCRGAF